MIPHVKDGGRNKCETQSPTQWKFQEVAALVPILLRIPSGGFELQLRESRHSMARPAGIPCAGPSGRSLAGDKTLCAENLTVAGALERKPRHRGSSCSSENRAASWRFPR